MGLLDSDRYVFFKCHDCGRAFWKMTLLPPRDNYVQHPCIGGRTATRIFGLTARTCTQNHPNSACVEKISQEEYTSLPNCGSWEKHLTGAAPRQQAKRKRPSSSLASRSNSAGKNTGKSVKVRKIRQKKPKSNRPKDMKKAVKNILRQNRLVHKRKKKGWMRETRTSVWDPGDCADSWNELKVPLEQEGGLYNTTDFDDSFDGFKVPRSFGISNFDFLESSIDEVDSATSEYSEEDIRLPAALRADWRLPPRFSFGHHVEADRSAEIESSDDDNTPKTNHITDMSFSHSENSPKVRPWKTQSKTFSPAALDYFKNHCGTLPNLGVDKHSETPTLSMPDDSENHSYIQTSPIVRNYQNFSETPMPSILDDLEDFSGSTVISGLDECESDIGSSRPVVLNLLESKSGSLKLKSLSKMQQSSEALLTYEEKDILTYIDGLLEENTT